MGDLAWNSVFKVEYLLFLLLVAINSLSHTVIFAGLDVSL